MVGMKSDMAGAAAVLVATVAMARIKPKVKVTALLIHYLQHHSAPLML
jgi:leucyl aminopeptidase